MIFFNLLCVCIIVLLIVGIRCLIDGIKDLCYELAGIYNLVSDIRCQLTEKDELNRESNN